MTTLSMVIDRLRQEGYRLDDDLPAAELAGPAVPWTTRVLLGICGWIAGLFLVGFCAMLVTSLMQSGAAMLVLALLLCTAASATYRKFDGELAAQFALAASLAGQVFFVLGLSALLQQNRGVAIGFALAIFQVVLVAVMPNFLHRILSTFVACAAFHYALHDAHVASAGSIVIATGFLAMWMREAQWRARRDATAWAAVAWGLALAFLLWSVPAQTRDWLAPAQAVGIAGSIGPAGALVAFAWWATEAAGTPRRLLAILAAALLAAAAWRAPGVVAAIVALLAGYRVGAPALVGLAFVALAGYLSVFYYQMDQTLLVKAGALAATGVTLLLARVAVRFAWPRGEAP